MKTVRLLLVRLRDNRLYVRIEDNDVGLVDLHGTQTLAENQWVHVAVVQDGHALRIYANTNSMAWQILQQPMRGLRI